MAFKTWSAGDVLTAGDVNSYLMRQVTSVCTSTTRPGSPVTGQMCYETDTGYNRRFNGTIWVLWPPGPQTANDGSNLSTTSTSWQAGTPNLGVTFTGPAAGRVMITVGGQIEGSTDGGFCLLSFQLRLTDSSGTVVVDSDDANALICQGTSNLGSQVRTFVTGLNEGQQYYVRAMHRSSVSGQTATVFQRRLIVEPCAN